jgi:alkyldihydroxyacetonephosphate synthase
VVWPRSTEEVAAIVELCRAEGFELVPFGAGSGVCGAVSAGERTLVLDLKRMAAQRVNREAPSLEVGPGALGITLEEEVERQGFTIGHFPSSIICSTVGGWVAARGAGQCSSRYGKIEDMLVGAECVLGDGRVVRFRRRAGGLDLTPLLVGSEGALGVLTNLELRLATLPEERRFLAFELDGGAVAMNAVRRLLQDGLRPVVARLYDALDTILFEQSARHPNDPGPPKAKRASAAGEAFRKRAVERLLGHPKLLNGAVSLLERSPLGRWLLILIFEGEGAGEDAARATALLERERARSLGEAPARRWYEHRYAVSFKQSGVFRSGAFSDTLEVAAPWSRLEGLFDGVRRALGRHVLVLAHLSHAYPDGCSIYFTFTGAAASSERALAVYDSAWRDALAAARDAGGAISHHHGIGRSKARALADDLGPAVPLMRRVLRAWDPSGIMNPGVLLPADATASQERVPYPEPGLDELSELVTLKGDESLDGAEARLRERGFTLGADLPRGLEVGGWVARGFPGARDAWLDPAGRLLAGLVADFESGERLTLAPAPRRSTGPDLTALVVGAAGALAKVERCTLKVQRLGAREPRPLPFSAERSPAVSPEERAAFDAIRG